MPPIRFIHAADLHLDAAFSGLSRDIPADFAERLRTATFTAFRRLLDLCERESPDFLLLAGDVYNQEDASVSARAREGPSTRTERSRHSRSSIPARGRWRGQLCPRQRRR